ncbi:DNA replication and repair protein RecF [Candidatus Gottesmanbacteria bacterium]|nr:DNA replication and repair protein RecF [Candidatus Gottesmanbacteria bacterium]
MIIQNLTLQNFRNYPKKVFSFSPDATIIIGDNAIGKTNLMEAIFFLSTGKSFRAEKDAEMIEFGKEVGRVGGEIIQSTNSQINKSTNEKIELEIVLTRGEVMGMNTPVKKYTVNGVGKRMVDFVGELKTVLFWPEDLELVTDSPSLRRRYLDFVLVQADREYRRSLVSYEKGLRQRNKVLEAIRERGAHRHQLLFWDQLLIKAGEYITRKREEYINYLNNSHPPAGGLNSQIDNYHLEYDKSVISEARLAQYSEEEVAAAATLVGPHRDDMGFSLNSTPGVEARDLSHFGSRGEQRLAILWLKLGELAYIEETTGEKPVLLLDDIFSELDHEHRKIIFDMIGNQQTIMTTTDMHLLEKEKIKDAKMVEL